jgi:hypothetical protein
MRIVTDLIMDVATKNSRYVRVVESTRASQHLQASGLPFACGCANLGFFFHVPLPVAWIAESHEVRDVVCSSIDFVNDMMGAKQLRWKDAAARLTRKAVAFLAGMGCAKPRIGMIKARTRWSFSALPVRMIFAPHLVSGLGLCLFDFRISAQQSSFTRSSGRNSMTFQAIENSFGRRNAKNILHLANAPFLNDVQFKKLFFGEIPYTSASVPSKLRGGCSHFAFRILQGLVGDIFSHSKPIGNRLNATTLSVEVNDASSLFGFHSVPIIHEQGYRFNPYVKQISTSNI